MEKKDLSMETEICHNCKREVPQANYLMHVAHCARNMAVCPVCGDAVPKARLKEHRNEEHAVVECPDCRCRVQRAALAHHCATSCGKRAAPCPYCALELPWCDMQEHETYCGARTERCPDCGELVMLKYRQLHLDSNHGFFKLNDEPGPTPSWEAPLRPRNTFSGMSALSSAISNRSNEVNVASQQPVANKTDYKAVSFSEGSSEPSPRDAPRALITPYDASDDLRAKVKLARHRVNEIKNSFLMNEDRRDKDNTKYSLPNVLTDVRPAARPREKFVTNLVPYEKNESYKVNARNLDEPKPGGFYNYLGAKEPLNEATSLTALPSKAPDALDTKVQNKTLLDKMKTKFNGRSSVDLSTRNTFSGSQELPTADKTSDKAGFSEISTKTKPRSPKHTGALPKKTATCNGTIPKRHEGGSKPARRKAPPPPPDTSLVGAAAVVEAPVIVDDGDEEEVRLPCEFCEKMVPASRLVLHETGCRPDLTQIEVPREKPTTEYTQPSADVQLPCEFCLQLVPASQLLSHQALCDA